MTIPTVQTQTSYALSSHWHHGSCCLFPIAIFNESVQIHILDDCAEAVCPSSRSGVATEIGYGVCFELTWVFDVENGFGGVYEGGEGWAV